MPLVTSETFDQQMILAGLGVGSGGSGAAPTPLVASKMHLFTTPISPTKTNVPGDFTQPTYSGYAAQTITWALPKRDAVRGISTDSGLVAWQMSNADTPTLVYGWFLTNSAGTVYLMGELLASAVNLSDALSFLGLVVEFIQSNTAPGGATVIS